MLTAISHTCQLFNVKKRQFVMISWLVFPSERFAFCGNPAHFRSKCPARQRICYKRGRKGHFAPVCRSKDRPDQRRTTVCTLAPCPSHPSSDDDNANVLISVNGVLARWLLYTAAKRNHVNLAFFRRAVLAVTDNHREKIVIAILTLRVLRLKQTGGVVHRSN